jgi:tetratricopeptide (TPR) repeat protein
MEVKFPGRLVRLGATVLALGVAAPLPLSADDGSSVEFVMASDDAGSVELPPVAEPSELVVQIADDAPSAQPAAQRPVASGDLTVVANVAKSAPVAATVIADSSVTPAGSIESVEGSRDSAWGAMLSSGPRRPSPMSGIQMRSRSRTTAAPAAPAARPAQRRQRVAATQPVDQPPPAYDPADISVPAASVAAPKIQSPADHAKSLLVQAYQLSLSASTEAEYSQIVQWCATASRSGLDEESAKFGAQLSGWALNRRGQVRADEGQQDLAQADFRAALEFDGDNWRALHNQAVTHAQGGQFAEAFDDVCRVIQLNPEFAKAYSNRATLYVQAGDYEKAFADYDAALAIDAKLVPALVGRGRLRHLQGQLDEALASFDAAVECASDDANVLCSRADLLADLGRYEDALADYAAAIDLNSQLEHAFRNGAWLLATCPDESIRDVEGAIAGAQAALECGYGDRHAALDTLAAAYANAGRFDEAVLTVHQAIEIAPEEARPAYESRLALYEAGQPFRSQPVGAEAVAATAEAEPVEPSGDEQAAVYIEE